MELLALLLDVCPDLSELLLFVVYLFDIRVVLFFDLLQLLKLLSESLVLPQTLLLRSVLRVPCSLDLHLLDFQVVGELLHLVLLLTRELLIVFRFFAAELADLLFEVLLLVFQFIHALLVAVFYKSEQVFGELLLG